MTVSIPPPTLTSESQRLSHPSFNRPLGLGPSPSGLAIFCNRANTKTWYTLDANTQPQELEYPALTGYLVSIEFLPKEYRGEKSHKLRFKIQADRLYTLEAGYRSVFAKGFLSAIAMLTPEQLRQPIIVEATPSDQEEKVLFCSIWLGSEKVYFHWDDQTNWKAIAQRAMANVAAING